MHPHPSAVGAPRKRPPRRLLALFLLLALSLAAWPAHVQAEELVSDRNVLPKGLSDPMVAATGGYVYVLGGSKEGTVTRDILRVDPSGLSATKIADLPAPRMAGAVAALDGKVYVFGGADWVGGAPVASSDIIVFDPASGSVETLALVRLPAAMIGAAAATDGDRIFIFGGYQLDPPERRDRILVFDPDSGLQGQINNHAARLPYPLQDAAVAYDGTRFVIAGGLSDGGEVKSNVLWFRLARSRVDEAPYELPTTLRSAAAAGRDGTVHVAGGALDGARRVGSPAIMRLTEDEAVNLTITLDPSRWSLGAARIDRDLYVVGGRAGADEYSRGVLVMDARESADAVATEPLQIVSLDPEDEAPVIADDDAGVDEDAEAPLPAGLAALALLLVALRRRSHMPTDS